MISRYEPNVKATIAFLRLLGVKVNNSTVNESLQSHPDWPSLLCISDSLNKWNIPNAAGRIDKNEIEQLPLPFIACTYDRESRLAIVTHVSDTAIEYYSKSYAKSIHENRESFLNKWNAVYLIAETTEHSGEPEYKRTKRKAYISSLIPVAFFSLLLIFLSSIIYRVANNEYKTISTVGIYTQYIFLLTGVIITSLLLWYESDKSNPILQKVCTGIAKGNCNAILTGKRAKLFSWLSWSEIGFFYFTGSLLSLLFIQSSIPILAWLSVLALPYTIFSVYYQWKVAKQWCVLCLAVQVLLIAGTANVLTNDLLISFSQFSSSLLPSIISLYLLPALTWFVMKPYILRLQQAKTTKREFLRIKFNTEVFDSLLKRQTPIIQPVDNLGIDLGNPGATNTLIKVCNPYCGPCAKAHPKIEKLLDQQGDKLHVKIVFTAQNEEDSLMAKPVRHLLAIADQQNEVLTKKALDDWYLPEEKDYAVFTNKYPMNGELKKQGHKMEAMDKWCREMKIMATCREMKIMATPTIFINGYQLPDAYSIEDLQYFLLE